MVRLEDPVEMTLYRNYYRAAESGDMVPRYDAILEFLGEPSNGTIANVDRRLVNAGLILIETYQRSRRVFVAELGKWTATPPNTSPHWRQRPEHAGRTKGGRIIQAMRVQA